MKKSRETPIEISKEEFQQIGYQLIDQIAEFTDSIKERPVTTGETLKQIQDLLGTAGLPKNGTSASAVLSLYK